MPISTSINACNVAHALLTGEINNYHRLPTNSSSYMRRRDTYYIYVAGGGYIIMCAMINISNGVMAVNKGDKAADNQSYKLA